MANASALPGLNTARDYQNRTVCKRDGVYLSQGVTIDGSNSRDPLNTGAVGYLRAGMLLGRITATSMYRPAIIGVTTSAYASSGSSNTSLQVSAATATEVARLGSSGTLKLVGPPTAAGTVAVQDVTYSAVNTSTGVITISALGANAISGSLVCPSDGAHLPKVILPGEDGPLCVLDEDCDSIDVQLPRALVGGEIDSSQMINWPSNAVLQTWIKDQLQEYGGRFTFDDALI